MCVCVSGGTGPSGLDSPSLGRLPTPRCLALRRAAHEFPADDTGNVPGGDTWGGLVRGMSADDTGRDISGDDTGGGVSGDDTGGGMSRDDTGGGISGDNTRGDVSRDDTGGGITEPSRSVTERGRALSWKLPPRFRDGW